MEIKEPQRVQFSHKKKRYTLWNTAFPNHFRAAIAKRVLDAARAEFGDSLKAFFVCGSAAAKRSSAWFDDLDIAVIVEKSGRMKKACRNFTKKAMQIEKSTGLEISDRVFSTQEFENPKFRNLVLFGGSVPIFGKEYAFGALKKNPNAWKPVTREKIESYKKFQNRTNLKGLMGRIRATMRNIGKR